MKINFVVQYDDILVMPLVEQYNLKLDFKNKDQKIVLEKSIDLDQNLIIII